MWLVSHLLPERYQNSVFFQKLFVTNAKYETQEKQTLVPASNNGNSDVYITCRALFIWGKFNLTKLNQYITLPCNTINHFSSQLFLRQEILLQNNSAFKQILLAYSWNCIHQGAQWCAMIELSAKLSHINFVVISFHSPKHYYWSTREIACITN
jgi:hypothetical protein